MNGYYVTGRSPLARFTLKIHRGEGMVLVAMNWKVGQPPNDFVGFAIEYKEPGGTKFFVLNNRLGFRGTSGSINPNALSTRLSPIQKFRWVHFPRNAEIPGAFLYRVTPVFMNDLDVLSYGDSQEVAIELGARRIPGCSTLPSLAVSCLRRHSWTDTSPQEAFPRCSRRTLSTD